jgi:hypothetical protein
MKEHGTDRDGRSAAVVEPELEWPPELPPGLRPWIENVIVPILADEWIKENCQKSVAPAVAEVAEFDQQTDVEVHHDRNPLRCDLRQGFNGSPE